MNVQEKILGVTPDGKERKIVVTHVTIRQSIVILLFRLVVLELLAAFGIIMFHTLVISTNIAEIVENVNRDIVLFNAPLLFFLISLKTGVMIFVIIRWLNEYYEITPKEIIFRRGLFFKKEELNTLDHIGSIEIDQGLLGRIFNFGTIKLFNWASEKYFSLYLIHNPMKYHYILKTILPEVDKEKQVFREHLIEPEEL